MKVSALLGRGFVVHGNAKLEYKEGLICKYETAGQVLATMRMLISGLMNFVLSVIGVGGRAFSAASCSGLL